ncbi:MAG: hypothetical protein Q4F05_19335 [bacterium]|nr:hypothetical protein [bacterium]
MKNSKKAKSIGYIFLGVAMISLIGGIVLVATQGVTQLDVIIMWLISSALWVICGIIILRSSKVLKEKEDSKPKINAFNYGKRKDLHKKVK